MVLRFRRFAIDVELCLPQRLCNVCDEREKSVKTKE